MSKGGRLRWLAWAFGGVLVAGCLLIWRDVTSFGFVGLDDDYNITFNPHLGPWSWARVKWAFADVEYSRRYLPLGWLGFAGVFGFSGLAPAGYNAAALILHGVNALLVAAALRAFLRRELGETAESWRHAAVFFAAAFWAWHPLRVESVAWASGLLYEMSTAWVLAALWLHPGERRGAAVACLALALLTYPAVLGAVVLFFAIDARRLTWRELLWRNAGYLAVGVAAALVNSAGRFAVTGNWPAVPTWAEFPLWQRAVQGLYVWAHYLWRPWWPAGHSPVDPVLLHPAQPGWQVALGASGFVALAVLVACLSRVRAVAGGWLLVHALVLVPVLGFWEKPHFPSDRYALLPQLVMAAALAMALARIQARRAAVVAAAVLVGFAVVAARQSEVWRDEATLWRHIRARVTVADSPVLACARPALAMFRDGDTTGALALVDAGLRERPGEPAIVATRAEIVERERANRERAERLGLRAAPSPGVVLHHAMAVRLTQAGETEAAAWHLREVARLAPDYFEPITRAARPPCAR